MTKGKDTFSVLLDTSFFIRLLSVDDALHTNAMDYYKYFLDNQIEMKISTISIAEYCVRGNISELPLSTLKVLPFNLNHAKIAGNFAKILFEMREKGALSLGDRLIIPNDCKILAQAAIDTSIKYFVTSDKKSANIINAISAKNQISFSHLDISISYGEMFGIIQM